MMKILNRYKFEIRYIFFGILTTFINIIVYGIFYNKLTFSNVDSNIIAWLIAVLFAYITNKMYVFNSKVLGLKNVIVEVLTFLLFRLGTGILDLVFMYISVDKMAANANIMKIASNIIVVITNYYVSKFIIFKKDK